MRTQRNAAENQIMLDRIAAAHSADWDDTCTIFTQGTGENILGQKSDDWNPDPTRTNLSCYFNFFTGRSFSHEDEIVMQMKDEGGYLLHLASGTPIHPKERVRRDSTGTMFEVADVIDETSQEALRTVHVIPTI
jgi:hypothetical protein